MTLVLRASAAKGGNHTAVFDSVVLVVSSTNNDYPAGAASPLGSPVPAATSA